MGGVAGGRPILTVETLPSRCIARRYPSRTVLPARADSFDGRILPGRLRALTRRNAISAFPPTPKP